MADYWKSQARKYCEFCKCWIADNKPSVEFHEKGRRHKENVEKKIRFITKKSRHDERESVKADAMLKQMESAALEAYRKDVENNADLSSAIINKKLEENNLKLSGPSDSKKLWKEAKTQQGKTYYCNVITNETVWQPPEEGYMTIAEQQQQMDEITKLQLKLVGKQQKVDALLTMQQQKKGEEEARAAAFREKMKERRVEPEPQPTVTGPILPTGKNDPYGQWTKVETTTTNVDLQLPEQEEEYYEIPVPQYEPPPKEFKERTVESLGNANETFKKRKFGSSAKRNTRQRLNDD